MHKRSVHAGLIERGETFRSWSLRRGYCPRTVTEVVGRWAGRKTLPRGAVARKILKDISEDLGREVAPGILEG